MASFEDLAGATLQCTVLYKRRQHTVSSQKNKLAAFLSAFQNWDKENVTEKINIHHGKKSKTAHGPLLEEEGESLLFVSVWLAWHYLAHHHRHPVATSTKQPS